MEATTKRRPAGALRVDGVTYRSPDEARVGAEQIEHAGETRADGYRRNGDEGMADVTIDRAREKAERLRAWAREREEAEARGTDQPARRPPASSSSSGEQFSPRRALRRAGAVAGKRGRRVGRQVLEPTREGALTAGELAVYVFGTIIALALLEAALGGRGPAGVDKALGLAGGALKKLTDPTDPLFGKTDVQPSSPPAAQVVEPPAGAQGPVGTPSEPPAVPPAGARGPVGALRAGGFLPKGALYKRGRVDAGRDFQTKPGGAIVAPGEGVVVAVKSDPHGFGPNYPIVKFTTGLYAGKELYIGHTHAALKAGQRFVTGQVLAHTGKKPVGNASSAGWAEIGYAHGGTPGKKGQHPPF